MRGSPLSGLRDRERLLLLVMIMAGVALAVAGVSIWVLYRAAFAEDRARLVETAQSQARLIEAVARYNARSVMSDHPGGAAAATLAQVIDAHERYAGFGRTGEFTLARREGGNIVFLLGHRHGDLETPKPISWQSELAEPMRRALEGRSGTVIGFDYRGVTVLAAHEPVAVLDLGIVAKIDLAEIRAPFIRAGMVSGGGVVLIVLLGTALFRRVSAPILERERAEQALEESEELFRRSFEDAGVGMVMVEMDGRFRAVNRAFCEMLGYSAQELLDRTFAEVTHPNDLERGRQGLQAMAAGERNTVNVEKRYLHKRGHAVWVSLSGSLIRDGHGRPVHTIAHIQDITERKRAEADRALLEQKLLQSQKMEALGTLAGGIAHDFNNILVPVIGLVELTRDDLEEGSEARRNLGQVLDAALRARALVRQILTFSRQDQPNHDKVDLAAVIEESVRLLRATLPATIGIRTDLDHGIGRILADANQIHQVMINLCRNAADAMNDKGGQIEIQLEKDRFAGCGPHPGLKDGLYARLAVIDTGTGMNDETLHRAFDPFFTTKPVGKGTGMGLSVVHGIVRAHGGALDVSSEIGGGTRIIVYLPLLERPGEQPEQRLREELVELV